MDTPSREATYAERATWGTCPVCGAPPGISCIGDGEYAVPWLPPEVPTPRSGHLVRYNAAPLRVRLMAAEE